MCGRVRFAAAAGTLAVAAAGCAAPAATSTSANLLVSSPRTQTHLGGAPGQAPPMCPQPGAVGASNGKPFPQPTDFEVPRIRGPFTDVGAILQPDPVGGARRVSARLDVVADLGPTAISPTPNSPTRNSPIPTSSTDRAAAALLDDQLHAGTEPGLVVRRVVNNPTPGPFSVSLAALNAALYGMTPTGADASTTVIAPALVASSYTVYLITTVDETPCGLPGGAEVSDAIQTIARLVR